MSASNMHDVLQAFLEHRSAKAGNVSSTGESLLSYGWWELARWSPDYGVVVRAGLAYSKSTVCQHTRLGLYRWPTSAVSTPRGQGPMNMPEPVAIVTYLKQSDLLKCPFAIMMPGHYNTDGSCKCSDPVHRAYMIPRMGVHHSGLHRRWHTSLASQSTQQPQ